MVYNKMVRDKIPQIIKDQGEVPHIRILSDAEYSEALDQKLKEETGEFFAEKNLEELADILEVVYAQAENLGFTKEELHVCYERKHKKRGGFHNRVFLISKEG